MSLGESEGVVDCTTWESGQTSSRPFFSSVGLTDNGFVVVEHKVIDIALMIDIVLIVAQYRLCKLVAGTR